MKYKEKLTKDEIMAAYESITDDFCKGCIIENRCEKNQHVDCIDAVSIWLEEEIQNE